MIDHTIPDVFLFLLDSALLRASKNGGISKKSCMIKRKRKVKNEHHEWRDEGLARIQFS